MLGFVCKFVLPNQIEPIISKIPNLGPRTKPFNENEFDLPEKAPVEGRDFQKNCLAQRLVLTQK